MNERAIKMADELQAWNALMNEIIIKRWAMKADNETRRDPLDALNGAPRGLTAEKAERYLCERQRTDARYREGGSRYKERG